MEPLHPHGFSRDLDWNLLRQCKPKHAVQLVQATDLFITPVPFIVEDPTIPKPSDAFTRFVCISDTHGLHDKILNGIPDGDVLIHAGDFSNRSSPKEFETFFKWLDSLPHPVKIVVAGNHDWALEDLFTVMIRHSLTSDGSTHKNTERDALREHATYLDGQAVTVFGQRIVGLLHPTRYTTTLNRFYPGAHVIPQYEQLERGMDVLITHGPPFCRCDVDPIKHVGSIDLLQAVRCSLQPRVHVFGHAHNGHGISFDGQTVYINCSVVSDNLSPHWPAIVFDLPRLPRLSSSSSSSNYSLGSTHSSSLYGGITLESAIPRNPDPFHLPPPDVLGGAVRITSEGVRSALQYLKPQLQSQSDAH